MRAGSDAVRQILRQQAGVDIVTPLLPMVQGFRGIT